MTEPTGHVCPECAAHRAQDGTPSCACTRRASDALRDERTAEAAAAEDFNPLRIRPYVELGTEHSGHSGGGRGPNAGTGDPDPAGPGSVGQGPGPRHAAPWAGEPSETAGAASWGPANPSGPVSGQGAPPNGSAPTGGFGPAGETGSFGPPSETGSFGPVGEAGAVPLNGGDPRTHGFQPVGGVEPMGSAYGVPPVGGVPMPPANGADAASATMQLAAIPGDGTMRPAPVPTDATMQLAAVPADAAARSAAMPADATMQLKALASDARATDVRLFHERSQEPGSTASDTDRPGRRRRTGVIALAGAVVTVVAAAGFAGGLLSYDPPSRDGALPKDVRAGAPEVLSDKSSTSPSASASSSASAPSASASASSPSASPSPSASESDASATPSGSASPTPTSAPPSATATATGSTASTGGGGSGGLAAPTLRRGDSGPEVTELQLRLSQLRLYMRQANGQFDRHLEDAVRWYQWARGITADESGVYGPATRASLEAETTQP
ncbi:peptidoglycan-binding protein [Streptomyces sp. NPDC091209]|uniref:peptidoglycan-binding protein n=1 Tax=Streptomyces sp. NPDC091209 TaxID=3365974 RepID=UPI00381982E1